MRFLPALLLSTFFAFPAFAQDNDCGSLPPHDQLQSALKAARNVDNGGLNLDMWGTVVSRDGTVCAIAYTGARYGEQWPGSRVISAQKANTANAFSLKAKALSTANLYSGTQPGGFLYGLQESNPVNVEAAYQGDSKAYGTAADPLVGAKIGGVNVFGGGLALYNSSGEIIGGLGVSGDTSCADHNIAWRVRHGLKLDYVPSGFAKNNTDTIIYDIGATGSSSSGFGHPKCAAKEDSIAADLPAVSKQAK